MANWQIYDDLIREVPDDRMIEEVVYGHHFIFLKAGNCAGVAHAISGHSRPRMNMADPVGRSLKSVAQGIKSWNLEEAAVGMAAVNAWYNSEEHIRALGLPVFDETDGSEQARKRANPFSHPQEQMMGKKVVVIGHFRHIIEQYAGICDLAVLEQNPQEGDYPDSACEFLIPQADYVFSTGMVLINKTLPRLLELGRNAQFHLVGPTGPVTPALMKYGVDCIDSFCVTDPDHVRKVIAENTKGLFQGGRMVSYRG